MYAQKAESELVEAQLQLTEAEKALAQSTLDAEEAAAEAQRAAKEAKAAADHAADLNKKAKEAIAEAEAAAAAAEAMEAALQAEEDAIMARQNVQTRPVLVETPVPGEPVQPNSFKDSDELLRMEKELKRLEKMQKDGDLARQGGIPVLEVSEEPNVDWSKAEAAYARAEQLEQGATDADKAAEQAGHIADQQTAYAEAVESKAAEAKQALLDAELLVKDAKASAEQAQKYAIQTKAQLEQLVYLQEHPKSVHTFVSELNYYSGNSAYQLTHPISFGYWHKDFSYSLNTKYIIAKNNTDGASGQVSTLSDTTLNFTKRNETPKYIVDYSLDINIPTGKSALSWSERNARMNEDLVAVSQFGTGWQFTPKIEASWRISKEDMWTVGTSYAFNGPYDPTTDISHDDISPGNEWRKFLRWQHAGRDWQFVGELSNTSTSVTKIANGEEYSTGDQWEYRLTYNRKLPNNQNIMLYYWRENQNINSIVPSDNSNRLAHYLGTMWSKKINEKRLLRVSFDIMKSNGRRYDRVNNYFDTDGNPQYTSVDVNGRTKYTLGLGYDIRLDEKSSFAIDLQKFIMKDGESSLGQAPTTYHGLNILMKYNKSI
ncbi:hypothetical protein [Methylomusa anaerophila]|nr:hypothetical protein [Methylomusa anaerophila]